MPFTGNISPCTNYGEDNFYKIAEVLCFFALDNRNLEIIFSFSKKENIV